MCGDGPAQIITHMTHQRMVKDGHLPSRKLLIVGKRLKHEQSRKKSSQTN